MDRLPRNVCLVSCYKDPGYVRIRTLEAGLRAAGAKPIIVRNSTRGFLRYSEVFLKLLKVRITRNPEIYLVTFRGYEILPVVLAIAVGKKVIFDEFINPIEWIVYEHKKFAATSLIATMLHRVYRYLLKRSDRILSDTNSHAQYSAALMHLPVDKYRVVAVGTDENSFRAYPTQKRNSRKFQVLYYGSMLPLHGVEYVVQAAVSLRSRKDIEFLLVGGGQKAQALIATAIKQGANILYKEWVPYKDLPNVIAGAQLCLGGPFGNTVQANMVITGKTLQFLRMKKPVVIGQNKETYLFKDKVDSIVVEQGSAKAVSDAVVWAYEHQSLLARLGLSGSRAYERSFSRGVIQKQILDALKNL